MGGFKFHFDGNKKVSGKLKFQKILVSLRQNSKLYKNIYFPKFMTISVPVLKVHFAIT